VSECVANRIFLLFQQQRTVYRLTLVKAWNVDELKAYADLISLGKPDFIEVKVSCMELFYFFFHQYFIFFLRISAPFPGLKLVRVSSALPKISAMQKKFTSCC